MPQPPPPEPQREMLALVTARVRDASLRLPLYVDGALDLVGVCRELSLQRLTQALVRDVQDGRPRLGIFTTTDLREALLRPEPPGRLAVREVARFELVEIDADADLFEALWLMVRHRVQRLVVRDRGEVVGVLGQLDLVGLLANHSHIAALQIDDAATMPALKAAAERVDAVLAMLDDGGVRVDRIARLVGELNRRLFAKLWALVAPAELVSRSCLVVMGSEGRGEQLLKTDQDNALLLPDGFEPEGLAGVTAAFAAGLAELGYPPCPGRIMVTNPLWCASVSRFRDTITHWVHGSDAEGPMNLAIFFDAVPAAGDARLLQGLREHLDRIAAGSDAFLARFAAAADQFDDSSPWWARLTGRPDEQALDLKKLGSFPIVHGIRALCLRHGVRESGSVERLQRLVELQHLDAELGRDLQEALHYLMGLKLRQQRAERADGAPMTNRVRPASLSTMERDQLKDALAIVKRFRALLRERFHLDAL